MGRPKSEDPGILISFRIPKSLYAWWVLEADLHDLTVPQLMKRNAVEDAEQGLDQLAQFEEMSKSAQSYRVGDTTPVTVATVPLHLNPADLLAFQSDEDHVEPEIISISDLPPIDLLTKLEESLGVAKAEKDADAANQHERAAIEARKRADAKAVVTHTRNTLARKTVTPNFKKDKK